MQVSLGSRLNDKAFHNYNTVVTGQYDSRIKFKGAVCYK